MTSKIEAIDRFELMMHGIQAMRRHVERLACPIQGGSGVRAHFYPHQIQNVQRILSATCIRHLIADEVGMGKTIQALMVATALRLQRGRLRVRVIVGRSELQSQWSEEICRSHQIIWDRLEPVFGDDWFEVVSESNIKYYAETFNANSFDLLIIDEPQSLKVETLRFISEHSADFASLLLLTASPNLRSVERFCELLQMLEPERIERARREVDRNSDHEDAAWSKSRLRDLEESELMEVVERFEENCVEVAIGSIDSDFEPDGVSPSFSEIAAHRRARMLTDLSWRYRRVLRSYREDYPDHLPRRYLRSFDRVEPTVAESTRAFIALNYARKHLSNEREKAFTFLRRSSVCSESFQSQLRSMKQIENSGSRQIEELATLSSRSNADARLDFLVDWLVRFWQSDPNFEVLIAAQDNATVDELEKEIGWRIPFIGPRGRRKPLQIATARDIQSTTSESDHTAALASEAIISLSSSQLREFKMGGKQLLIATDSFRQSYNLQSADALVFYSIPWSPEETDQWIGRVDRLGRGFVSPEERKSPPKPVQIVTIHRHGDPTVSVERVFTEYRILESAADMERDFLDTITNQLSQAIFSDTQISSAQAPHKRNSREVQPPNGSRWNVRNAISVHSEIAFGDAMEPQLRHSKPLGFVSNMQEQCLASWIKLLGKHQEITSWKVKKEFTDGSRRGVFYTLSQVGCSGARLGSLEDRSKSFPAFFIARRNIYSPPRLRVVTGIDANGHERDVLLQFLSHGSELHEELIETYRLAGRFDSPIGISLYVIGPRHYPNGTSLKPGTYLVGAGFIDSAKMYDEVTLDAVFLKWVSESEGSRRKEMREHQLIQFKGGIEADQRFVRMVAPTKACCLAFQMNGTPCDDREAADILSANWTSTERPISTTATVSERFRTGLPTHFRVSIALKMKSHWSQSYEHIKELVSERVEMIRVEAFDVVWNLRAAIAEASTQILKLEEDSTEKSRQTIQLTYQPRLDSLNEELRIVEMACEFRCELLKKSMIHIENPHALTVDLQAVAVVGLENDLVPIPAETTDAAMNPASSDFSGGDSKESNEEQSDFRSKPR